MTVAVVSTAVLYVDAYPPLRTKLPTEPWMCNAPFCIENDEADPPDSITRSPENEKFDCPLLAYAYVALIRSRVIADDAEMSEKALPQYVPWRMTAPTSTLTSVATP